MSGAFIDTNVWVYAVDEAEPTKQLRAKAAIQAEMAVGIIVSAQVLGEFYVTATRKLPRPLLHEDARAYVRDMRRQRVVPIGDRLVDEAIAGAQSWQLSYWDALLLVAARTAGCDRLLTEDLQHGRVIDGVTIVNPFLADEAGPEGGPGG